VKSSERCSQCLWCANGRIEYGGGVLGDSSRDDFVCYEWVNWHYGEYFGAVVAYLRGLLDKEDYLIDMEWKSACKRRFGSYSVGGRLV